MTPALKLWMLDDERRPVPTTDFSEWCRWLDEAGYPVRVAETTLPRHVVSTVFLGVNHRYDDGLPLLFETMVWEAGEGWVHQVRYVSWDDAEAGHASAVRRIEREEASPAVPEVPHDDGRHEA